ncbi:carbohydrate ABC transporter permease [Microbacterium ulmi]|uniref:Sugar ABC transporter permease n=1 Tax=Microbacterium ulmi TaxID=179095 RepID=A0A7Y2M0A9_9MICO|nr:sugar ABC transporter permease [Microbacterium ulmi]NII69907.1 multiple sugar transport system permease protein [Microbacterium ulmi]NNH03827.1 sugar ABC transporter permease [Microbacterium ulmi]
MSTTHTTAFGGAPGGVALLEVEKEAPRQGNRPSRRRLNLRGRNRLTPWLYAAAALILLITFTYVPTVNMIAYSFTNWDGLSRDRDVVGLANYVKVFTDPRYWQVFFVSLYYFVASFVQIAIALYFATILSFKTRFRNFFKGVLFFPYLLNGVAVGFIFLYLFQPGGTLDTVLSVFGVQDPPHWLGDPDIANISLAGTSVWRFTGLSFVLFLGAIQSIPGELYEASDLDGASRWQQFIYIIAPGIKRIISLSFILAIAGSLSVFEIPFVMTNGANGTSTFVIQTIQTAFNFQRVGLASAMAVVLLAIVLTVTWIQRRLVPDEDVNLS